MNNQNKLTKIFQQLRLSRIVTAFLLATVLLITTACNSGDKLAARPHNSSVTPTLLATANQSETTYPNDDRQMEGLLYSNSNEVKSLNSVDDFVSPQRQKELLDPTQIPAKKQPIIDRSDPNNKLLEKTVQMFKDATDF